MDSTNQSGDFIEWEVPWLFNGLIFSHVDDLMRTYPDVSLFSEYQNISRWVRARYHINRVADGRLVGWVFNHEHPWTPFFSWGRYRGTPILLQLKISHMPCHGHWATGHAQPSDFPREDRRKQRAKWWDPRKEDEPPSTVWDAQIW
jgi:hypothetical protein